MYKISINIYFQVLDYGDKDNNKCKVKEKKLIESEELNFLLQSGIILCKLAAFIVPDTDIQLDNLQVGTGESVQCVQGIKIKILTTDL